MSSIVLNRSDAYINVGAAKAWREYLLNHTCSIWFKTSCTSQCCLVSLNNEHRECFSIDINISSHPPRDATSIAHKYAHVPPTRFLQSVGSRVQKAPVVKSLRPVKQVGLHGAILGDLSGGVRVKVEDDNGNAVIAETPVPILADGAWHYLQVTVEGNEISVSVDQNHVSVSYVRRDANLSPLDWTQVGERVVYPSFDLIGARFNKSAGVRDFYCGYLADIAVEIGHPGGHKLHWWVTEASAGTVIWDRGSGAKQHVAGLHLNLCSCSWDTTDFPATGLLLNGYEGRKGTVPELTEAALESMAKPFAPAIGSNESSASTSPKSGSACRSGSDPPSCSAVSPSQQGIRTSDESGGGAAGDEPNAPVSQTMGREYFERVQQEEKLRQPMSFALWLLTRDRDPAVVFTAPFRYPVHLILNLDCKPSVALVNGIDAFVAHCDVTDGKWHHIRWIIDPNTGASLFLDGMLAPWQYVGLHVDEEGVGPIRTRSASNSDESLGCVPSMYFAGKLKREQTANVGFRSDGAPLARETSITDTSANEDFQAALRRRSVVTSLLNLHSDKKAAAASEVEPGAASGSTASHAAASWRRARARCSIAFVGENNAVAGRADSANNLVRSSSSATQKRHQAPEALFAADETQLFGELLEEVEGAGGGGDGLATSAVLTQKLDDPAELTTFLSAVVQQDPTAAFTPSSTTTAGDGLVRTISNQFVLLSIKKRREILEFLTALMHQAVRRLKAGHKKHHAAKDRDDKQQHYPSIPCFTLGTYFSGEIRDVTVKIGTYTFCWRMHQGSGRQIRPSVSGQGTLDGETDTAMYDAFASSTASESSSPGPLVSDFSVDVNEAWHGKPPSYVPQAAIMELSGRTVIFPKTIVPASCPVLDDNTTLSLGGIRIPVEPSSTGLDVDFFLRLHHGTNSYGHAITVEGAAILEVQKDRIALFFPAVVDDALVADAIRTNPDVDAAVLQASVSSLRLLQCHADSSMLEDRHWHHVRVVMPSLHRYRGVIVVIDEIPLDLTTTLVLEQFTGGTRSRSSAFRSSSSRRGTVLFKPPLAGGAEGGRPSVADPSLSLSGRPSQTPQPQNHVTKHFLAKKRLLLSPLSGPLLPAIAQAAHDCRLASLVCGGYGFSGSVVHLHVVANGQEYRWGLMDSSRTKLARCPPLLEDKFRAHSGALRLPHESIPMCSSVVECETDVHAKWQPTTLPSRALHFDGHSSFVSAVNLRSNFHMSNLKHFAVSMWVKSSSTSGSSSSGAGGGSDDNAHHSALRSGCIFTVHDLRKPTTEASCGIFTHTHVDEHSSPRKRVFQPYVTSFLLVDSCARALCLEVSYDIYDGLWHKIQWVVFDSEANEAHVFVDDVAVSSRLVVGDSPREFTCRKPVLNLGARNEGDNDVANFFAGEIRNFRFSRNHGDDILSWPMTEGDGYLLNDEAQRISGCVWAPDWVYTPFPPMTPILRPDTIIEFSPVGDIERTAHMQPVWFTFSIKSNSSTTGAVWSIVSADRTILASFVANEGGDHERRVNEPGSHILRVQRIVRKAIFLPRPASNASDRGADDEGAGGGALSLPLTPRGGNSGAGGFLDDVGCAGAADFGRGSMTLERELSLDVSVRSAHTAVSRGHSPHQQQHKHRKMARRAELADMLREQKTSSEKQVTFEQEDPHGGIAAGAGVGACTAKGKRSRTPPRRYTNHKWSSFSHYATVLEERAYQCHFPNLCNGSWHNVMLCLPPDPTVEDAKIVIDELDVEAMHLSTTDVRELPENIRETLDSMPATTAGDVRDRSPLEVLRDQITWASIVLGRTAATSLQALHCCVRNFGVLINEKREELLFAPFASTMDLTSSIPRDVAATSVTWELSVPPVSCITLGGERYIQVPPLRQLRLNSFEVSFRLRTTATAPACVLEFGDASRGYFCIMLNQDAFGEPVPNTLRLCLSDADGKELHTSCFLSPDDVEDTDKRQRVIDDDQWHDICVKVYDTSKNHVVFEVDGTVPQIRYANCGSPSNFRELTDGGTIGALLDVLRPTMTLYGCVKNILISSLLNGAEVAADPSIPLQREVHASYEATSGFASILADRSGNRNHALAVNPVWRTDLQTQWPPFSIPTKSTTDIFSSCNITVSRWSNNSSDTVEKNARSGEVVIDEFPEDGWASGSKGPQWISLDFGTAHMVFAIEVDVFRSSVSTHEIYVSRSNLSQSATYNGLADAKDEPTPQATLLQTVSMRTTSPRTIRISLQHPLQGLRWMRVVTSQSVVPVGFEAIRIIAVRGNLTSARKYSVSEALGHSAAKSSAAFDSGPMLPMFPDTFEAKVAKSRQLSKKIHRFSVQWGGVDEDDVQRRSRSRSHWDDDDDSSERYDNASLAAADQLPSNGEELMSSIRKTGAARDREMRLLFYTQDVERRGYISLMDFLSVYRQRDILGLISEDQVLSVLRDAGVVDSQVNYEQFVKALSKLEST